MSVELLRPVEFFEQQSDSLVNIGVLGNFKSLKNERNVTYGEK